MWLELETCSEVQVHSTRILVIGTFGGLMRLMFEGSNNLSDLTKAKSTKPSHQTRIGYMTGGNL